jgi:hypothetical protein
MATVVFLIAASVAILALLAVCRRERNDGLHDRGVTVQVGRRGRVHA